MVAGAEVLPLPDWPHAFTVWPQISLENPTGMCLRMIFCTPPSPSAHQTSRHCFCHCPWDTARSRHWELLVHYPGRTEGKVSSVILQRLVFEAEAVGDAWGWLQVRTG